MSPLVVVDTNVLLAATDRGRVSHDAALTFLNEDPRRLAVTVQIVREYLAVATRPVEVNGLGMSGDAASANVGQFLDDMALLSEGSESCRYVMDLVRREAVPGKQVHDANIVAVAIEHGAEAIVTENAGHFARFADAIGVEPLR